MSTNVHEQNRIWLEKSIAEQYIYYYKDKDLTDRVLIGRGGYALVYKAGIKQSDIDVAIKQLLPLPSSVGGEEIYSIFVREVSVYQHTCNRVFDYTVNYTCSLKFMVFSHCVKFPSRLKLTDKCTIILTLFGFLDWVRVNIRQ